MKIEEIRNALNDLHVTQTGIQNQLSALQENVQELREQLGIERCAQPVNCASVGVPLNQDSPATPRRY